MPRSDDHHDSGDNELDHDDELVVSVASGGHPLDENEGLRNDCDAVRHSDLDGDETLSGLTLAYSASRHREALAERSDRELLWAVRDQSDESALDALIERKTGPLVQLAYRMLGDFEEARDIVQVTFFRLWEHRDKFDDRWSPNTWIYRICSNLAIDHIRARKSRERLAEPVRLHLRDIASCNADSDLADLEEIEVLRIFQELAGELTEKQRLVFLLREVEDRSSKEVAEIVGCRESTVRNHLFNARKLLREAVLQRYPEYAPRPAEDAR